MSDASVSAVETMMRSPTCNAVELGPAESRGGVQNIHAAAEVDHAKQRLVIF